MADLTADEITRLEQAVLKNDKSGTLSRRLKNLINNDLGPASVTYTIGAESANTITVSCQFKDANGDDMTQACVVRQYLADAATGQAVKAAATSLAAGTDGTILVEETAETIWTAISEADGDLDIVVGDAVGVDTYYLITVLPNGTISASDAITFA